MTPKRIDTPAAWSGPDINYRIEMMHTITDAEISEIVAALDGSHDLDITEISPETFQLGTFAETLKRSKAALLEGTGVLLLRGLQRADFSDDEMARVYVGLGTHMGTPVAQSWNGELLGNIIDVSDVREKIRGYNFGGGQNFHTDGTACDIVSLMCLRPALSGGASRIVSAVTLHNAMLETRPDLLEVLYSGYIYRYGEWDARDIPAPIQTGHRIPVFAPLNGGVCCVQETSHVRNAVQEGGVTLSEAEREAFDSFQQLAKSDEYYLDMDFQKGDVQFLNNRVILHGRTDYEDPEDVTERRHMLRLWLHVSDWPARPENQMFATRPVVDRWQERRRPGMDFPGAYLAEVAGMQRTRRKTGNVGQRIKGNLSASSWTGAS